MIFAHVDDESTRAELIDAIKSADKPYIYRRLMVIRLSSEGRKVSELWEIFQLTPQTIRKFIHAYNQGGQSPTDAPQKAGTNADTSVHPNTMGGDYSSAADLVGQTQHQEL